MKETDPFLDALVVSGDIVSYEYTEPESDSEDETLLLVFPSGKRLFIQSIPTGEDGSSMIFARGRVL